MQESATNQTRLIYSEQGKALWNFVRNKMSRADNLPLSVADKRAVALCNHGIFAFKSRLKKRLADVIPDVDFSALKHDDEPVEISLAEFPAYRNLVLLVVRYDVLVNMLDYAWIQQAIPQKERSSVIHSFRGRISILTRRALRQQPPEASETINDPATQPSQPI